jgi:hypothetical protein
MTLSRDDILGADDLKMEPVEVPEWGGTVNVKALTGTDRDAWEASQTESRTLPNGNVITYPNTENMRAKLVARAVVDDEGKKLFGDADINALGEKSAAALTRVWLVAARLSGLDDATAGEVEGNSEAAPGGSSSTDSPAT